ncbi:MAG: MOSC domain-containing protein [Saprospiraceae bacterium]|nr:MOSC domain-containing protein [Saprospiraceae bacterium]
MTIKDLINTLPQTGTVSWIGIRPGKRMAMEQVDEVEVSVEEGLVGDHYTGRSKKRQVTLIQHEHLQAVATLLSKDQIDPALTRRNIVISGINLQALQDQRFQIGEAVLETTGLCYPCSRMEENLGEGGYNAMRGHGGINARVIVAGRVRLGDSVVLLPAKPETEES